MNYSLANLERARDSIPPYPSGKYSGRGIVFAGGGSYLPSTYIAVRRLRSLGCTLPVQIWHLGTAEFPVVLQRLFDPLDVAFVDALSIPGLRFYPDVRGWQCKPYAIFHSPFEEVLSIDADNYCMLDPSFLFDDPNYSGTGQIFWPDFIFPTPNKWSIPEATWEFLNLTPIPDYEMETGQLVVHKRFGWRGLNLALHMTDRADVFYGRYSYGEKEIYGLSWLFLGTPPYVIPHRPRMTEHLIRYQCAPNGDRLFLHGRKWILPADKNLELRWYPNETECIIWLREIEQAFHAHNAPRN